MAEKKISQLTAKGATIADTDLLVVSESAGGGAYTSKSVTGANIKALVTDANLTTTDITTNDVSTTKHGFAPKAPNDTTKFLRGDGTWAVPVSGSVSGRFGIADSNGSYTYYTTLSAAMTAATAGQTIELFTDYTESGAVTITLKNGVNINGNGHTYNYTNATGNCFIDNGVAVTCQISNLKISRTNYTSGSVYVQSSSSSNTDWSGSQIFVTAGSGNAIDILGSVRNMWVKITGNGNAIYAQYSSSASIFNCYGESTGSGRGIDFRTGTVYNCTGISVSGYGIYGDQSNIYNSTFRSTSQVAAQYGTYYNSQAISSSSYGFLQGTLYNCTGISSSSVGISSGGYIIRNSVSIGGAGTAGGEWYNSIIQSSLSPAIDGFGIFTNCTIRSTWNNSNGHAASTIYSPSSGQFVCCFLEVANSSAYCFNAAASGSMKYANNTFKGSTTPVNANITQAIVNTQDNQGNILL